MAEYWDFLAVAKTNTNTIVYIVQLMAGFGNFINIKIVMHLIPHM
jgi:hypothetical protein